MRQVLLGVLILAAVLSLLVFANLTSTYGDGPDGRLERYKPYKYLPVFSVGTVNEVSALLIGAMTTGALVIALIIGIVLVFDGLESLTAKKPSSLQKS